LLPHAEAVLAAARDGERAIRDAVGTAGPRVLKVAIVGTLADSHLVDALRAFEARFGEASVELTTATSREVSALVRNGDAHLGLRYFVDPDPRLESKPIGAEKLFLVVPASHRIRQRRLRNLRQLQGERWLGFARERGQPDSFGRLLERALAATGVAEPRYTAVDSVALMPRSSVREELRIGSLRAIELQGLRLEQPVVAVQRRGGHQSPLAVAFLALLRDFTPGLQA
jgi:DNA-binding transcriptional LysR family regulator